jgi:hypothetical protein
MNRNVSRLRAAALGSIGAAALWLATLPADAVAAEARFCSRMTQAQCAAYCAALGASFWHVDANGCCLCGF